jgi:hypothetical protein
MYAVAMTADDNVLQFPRLRALGEALEERAVKPAPDGPSPNATDNKITSAHLIDSALHHQAHSMRHLERLNDPKVLADPEAVKFNVGHAEHHAHHAQDTLCRAAAHLEEHPSDPKTFKAERDAINANRQTPLSDPGTGPPAEGPSAA